MAFKFRKRVKVFPGFYVNLSKSGMSATVGMKGLNVNVGKKGTYLNTGIPGTGIYDRKRISGPKNNNIPRNNELSSIPEDAVEIKSYKPELITSEGLYGLKESIINAKIVKEELKKESNKLSFHKTISMLLMIISYILIIGFFIKWFKINFKEKSTAAQDAKDKYEDFKLDIDFNMDDSILDDYLVLKKNFKKLIEVETIWDITSSKYVDRVKERSSASTSVTRNKVLFSKSSLDFIDTEYEALKLQNANGGDLYIYPGFIVMLNNHNNEFGLVDFRDIKFDYYPQRFVEEERVPRDTKIVDRTWRYVNKNGSPDKRYKNNYEIPIVLYFEMNIKTLKGLNESYQFSNPDVGQLFCESFENYKNSLQKMNWKKDADEQNIR
ncbi:DUF4236 domain-containing protein [Halanaerobium salsuginis]|jgi:hypothetical protein|uniref:DUF4236 domain-containing protein n=1 Tax=Halanaerobium salsuginis TaxID=29563 RepID=A0A1I4M9K4_9FIRM|nr:DUF4236 domain-containing protein [Halanaerobium salsuginis]SFL99617.1 Protein of unknown function [Halanaerobium salsuginis]